MKFGHFQLWLAASSCSFTVKLKCHNGDVIKWKHFPRYWPFLMGMQWSPKDSPHKGQWRGALMLSLIYAWINGWVNDRDAGELKPHRAHYDVTVMISTKLVSLAPDEYIYHIADLEITQMIQHDCSISPRLTHWGPVTYIYMYVCVYARRFQAINTLRPRQNGRHFPDDISKWIFLNEMHEFR